MEEFSQYAPYLRELKSRLTPVGIVFCIALLVGFFLSDKITLGVLTFFSYRGVNIVMTSPFQFVGLSFINSLVLGIVCAMPLLIFQLIGFIKPALTKHEYHSLIGYLPWGGLLFISGFLFGFWVMRFVVAIYASVSNSYKIGNLWDLQRLYMSVLITSFLLGITFQFPIILSALVRFGFLKRS